jgi:hypothetical protein
MPRRQDMSDLHIYQLNYGIEYFGLGMIMWYQQKKPVPPVRKYANDRILNIHIYARREMPKFKISSHFKMSSFLVIQIYPIAYDSTKRYNIYREGKRQPT